MTLSPAGAKELKGTSRLVVGRQAGAVGVAAESGIGTCSAGNASEDRTLVSFPGLLLFPWVP